MIWHPITIFSRSSQAERVSSLRRRSQKSEFFAFIEPILAGLSMTVVKQRICHRGFAAGIANSKIQAPNLRLRFASGVLGFGIWRLGFPGALCAPGDRRDSNPQQPEPQSG